MKDARIVISRLRDITDWRVLGFELGVSETRLNAIDEDANKVNLNQGILAEEFYRMQFWWLVILVLIIIKAITQMFSGVFRCCTYLNRCVITLESDVIGLNLRKVCQGWEVV